MRIIAGTRRGMKLEPPRGKEVTRPISDRVKENLFNILQAEIPGSIVLDLFAGTGSLGLEALSRGARWATFVEQNAEAVSILHHNIEHVRFVESSQVVRGDALRLRPSVAETGRRDPKGPLVFDLVFADPPYRMMDNDADRQRIGESLGQLSGFGALSPAAVIVVRHDSRTPVEYRWPGFRQTDSRRYGSMTLDFLRPAEPSNDDLSPDAAPPTGDS
ncbi:MAG: 16S rRNA (guanine(966)-N(2))-methyltransferase RsmD [Planctomycetes bacterium]|nr:16S rRNA (guanine(966)-N(2))-methyltransferase RsmD [Planctomycetota bacterium]